MSGTKATKLLLMYGIAALLMSPLIGYGLAQSSIPTVAAMYIMMLLFMGPPVVIAVRLLFSDNV